MSFLCMYIISFTIFLLLYLLLHYHITFFKTLYSVNVRVSVFIGSYAKISYPSQQDISQVLVLPCSHISIIIIHLYLYVFYYYRYNIDIFPVLSRVTPTIIYYSRNYPCSNKIVNDNNL